MSSLKPSASLDQSQDILRVDHRQPLDAIFAPRNVAVIGATETVGAVGRTLLWNLVSNPFGGTVFPVNPKRPSVLGIKSYSSIAMVPEPVDLAVKAELAIQQGWASFEAEYRCADGTVIWGDTVLTTIVDEEGMPSAFVIVARDVSERHRREAGLIDEALTDPLTGLLNRRGLAARVAPWLDEARAGKALTISALALDIDFFKRVNDRHGHDGGDAVLRHLSHLLTKQFRRGDIVARLGGEEFVVLLRDAPDAIARASAERVRHLLEHTPLTWKDETIAVTTSIGVAFGAGLIEVEDLLHRADLALYRAKAEGRNRVVCL